MRKIIFAIVALFILSKISKPTVPATQKTVSNPLTNLTGGPVETLGGGRTFPGPALSAPYYSGNGDVVNTLAPNPLPNPTFEKTVPIIASNLVKASYARTISSRWLA